MRLRILATAACAIIALAVMACPASGAWRHFQLRFWVANQESATFARTACEEQGAECLAWVRSCGRIAPRRVNCTVGWWYPNFFDTESEFFCDETLLWGLDHWGLLKLRGVSKSNCELVVKR